MASSGDGYSNVTSHPPTFEPYVRPFDQTGIVTFSIFIFTFMVWGIVGNILTILVINANAKLRNVFMCFIQSLCVSDLISACISWLCLYRRTWGFDTWAPLPGFLCKVYWAGDLMTSYVTALHIFSFGVLRFVSIQFPVFFAKIKVKHVMIWILTLWTMSFVLGFIPFSFFFGAAFRDRYSDSPDARWPACTIGMDWYDAYTTYQKISYPCLLYAPLAGVVVISVLIIITMRSRTFKMTSDEAEKARIKKENQAVAQLILIVLSFLLGYIPFTAYEFWSVQDMPNTLYYKLADYWFGVIQYLFLRFSECLNPIFYNLGSAKLRGCTKAYLQRRFRCGTKIAPLSQVSFKTDQSNA